MPELRSLLIAALGCLLVVTRATAAEPVMTPSDRLYAEQISTEILHDYFETGKQIRVGYDAAFAKADNCVMLNRTKARLTEVYGEGRVEFSEYSPDNLKLALEQHLVDMFIADAHFVSQHETQLRLKALASLWPRETPDPSYAVGALYVTRAKRGAITTIGEIPGKRVGYLADSEFVSQLVPRHDLQQLGIKPQAVFDNASIVGSEPEQVIAALLHGDVDVGIIPACSLERLVAAGKVKPNQISPIEPYTPDNFFCQRSTTLYPSFYFAAPAQTDHRLVRTTSAALFTMGHNQDVEWTLPVSNHAIHALYFNLKIGPFEHLAKWSLDRFAREQPFTLALVIAMILVILSYSAIVSLLMRKRTQLLRRTQKERDRIENEAKSSRDHIANLERTGVVGQMSTIIAHELKQPLGAITNYANGLLRRMKRGPIEESVLHTALHEIVEQGTRASEIVNRVRSYAKQNTPELHLADMSIVIEKTIETFKRSRRTNARVTKRVPPYLWAEIDDWEIELAVFNLMKNAADALQGQDNAEIRVSVHYADRFWHIDVCDNGRHVTQETVDQFMMPLVTGKSSGMGLGLSIVSTIAERHRGHLRGTANPEYGVTITLEIPQIERP